MKTPSETSPERRPCKLCQSRFCIGALFLFIVVTGGLLRASHIEEALFWHDESFTQVFSTGHRAADMLRLFDAQIHDAAELRAAREMDGSRSVWDVALNLAQDEPQHPPLYYVAARAWSDLSDGAGESVQSAVPSAVQTHRAGVRLRWFSFFVSVAGFGAFFWLGKELFDDARRALTLSALYAVSPFFVLYAQEAREYTLWTVFIALSSAALLRARRLGQGRNYGLYCACLLLCLYTSLSTLSVLVAHVLFMAVELYGAHRPIRIPVPAGNSRPLKASRYILSLATTGLLFLPWVYLLAQHFEALNASMAWSREIRIPASELLGTFALNLSRTFVDTGADSLSAPGVIALSLLPLAVVVLGARKLRAQQRTLLLAMLAAPVLLLLVPDLLFGGIRSVSTRYLIPGLIALLCMAAASVGPRESEHSARKARTKSTYVSIGLLSLLLVSGALCSWRVSAERAPWTKGISRRLLQVAVFLENEQNALVVADHERHHPGNMLALSTMVPEGTLFQLLPSVEDYRLAEHGGPIFLFSPSPRFVEELESSAGVELEMLVEDLHLSLWRVRRSRRPL